MPISTAPSRHLLTDDCRTKVHEARSIVLGQDHRGVRPQPDFAAERHPVAAAGLRLAIEAVVIREGGAVATRVAIEAHPPYTSPRESHSVDVVGPVGEVEEDHDVVSGTAAVPAMERDHLVAVVFV